VKSLSENPSVPVPLPSTQGLSQDVAEAYAILQRRLSRAQERARGWIAAERCERSLNELLRHPGRLGSPQKLANVAWGNAGKVVRARASRLEQYEDGFPEVPDPDNLGHLTVEVRDAIENAYLPQLDRTILDTLLAGGDTHDVTERVDMPLPRAAVRVSRARQRIRLAWGAVA
jgi:hypothetical protein